MKIVGSEWPIILKETAKNLIEVGRNDKPYSFILVIGTVFSIKKDLKEAIKAQPTNNCISDLKVEIVELMSSQITKEMVSSLPILSDNHIGIIVIPDYLPNIIHYHLLLKTMFNPAKQQKTGWNVIAFSKQINIMEWQKDSAYNYFCEEKAMPAFQIIF